MVLQGHEGVPSAHLFSISPKQVVSRGGAGGGQEAWTVLRPLCLDQVVPAGGSSTIHISFTPVVLGPAVLHKVECIGYALGFMSLDDKVSPPGLGGATLLPLCWVARCPLSSGMPVIRLGFCRWRGNFRGGGAACRTSQWDP